VTIYRRNKGLCSSSSSSFTLCIGVVVSGLLVKNVDGSLSELNRTLGMGCKYLYSEQAICMVSEDYCHENATIYLVVVAH
jgi:hypothetical protein